LKSIVERVIIHLTDVEIQLRATNLLNEIGGGVFPGGLMQPVSIRCTFRHVQQGRAMRLIVGDTNITTDASRKAILKAIARARRWYEQLTTGEAESIAQLAAMHNVSPRFINLQLKLVQLSPAWIERMMTRPDALPLSHDDLLLSIPVNWNQQVFGMAAKLD
jgi:site-specific DNA recombinase